MPIQRCTPNSEELSHFAELLSIPQEGGHQIISNEFVKSRNLDPDSRNEMILERLELECNRPTSTWCIKAVDSETEETLGYAMWNQFSHPFFINENWIGVVKTSHLNLCALVVRFADQCEDITRLLLQWGIDTADSLGLEVVLFTHLPESKTLRDLGFTSPGVLVSKHSRHQDTSLDDPEPQTWRMQREPASNAIAHRRHYLDAGSFW